MSTNPTVLPGYTQINASINTLGAPMEAHAEATAAPDAAPSSIDRLLSIYESVKPLLTVLATLQIFPRSWRAALTMFNSALQAVADDLAGLGSEFKAGKDL